MSRGLGRVLPTKAPSRGTSSPGESARKRPQLSRATLACTLALAIGAAGCGSSGSSGTTTTTTTVAGAKSSTAIKGGVQPDTTPKYAAPPANAPVQSGTVQIAYRNIAINPDTVKVKVGTTLKWTNYDPVEHNVTSKSGPSSFASKNFGEGHTFEFKVTKAGIIHYECTIHPVTMNGTIEVVN
jgi:plastocyanin